MADHEPVDSDPEFHPKTVCGREMTAEISWYPRTLYQGRTIYFCTEFCLEAFKADPDRFFAAHSDKKNPYFSVQAMGNKDIRFFIGSEVFMVPSQSIRYIQYQQSKASFIDADTIFDTPVSLAVNGKNWLTFMCTPILLEELAIGFLFNERVIDNLDQVSDVRVCEHGDNVDM